MSVWVSTTIVCDGCGAERPVPVRELVKVAVQRAEDDGWSRSGPREHRCPACSPARVAVVLAVVR